MKILTDLEIVFEIEDLVKVIYAYFAHSPKKCHELHCLELLMEAKCLKLLKNVCTNGVALLHM